MTKNSLKSLATTLGLCSLLIFLWWCGKQNDSTSDTPPIQDQEQTNVESQQSSLSSWDMLGHSSIQNTEKLVIHTGCIGCGRCARVTQNVFSFQWGHAQVISQIYNDTQEVQMAIDRCPVRVIEKIST